MPNWDECIGLRFDTVASTYHHIRPRYPDVIWEMLFRVTGLQAGARVLEIGAGTGIAAAELIRRGFHVTAIEPGAAMAAMIARELGDTGRLDLFVGRFDEFEWTGEPFDLVIGATSLHWVERALLEQRLPGLVKPGGFAALLHYLHVAGGDQAFFEATQECYAKWDPNYQEYHLRAPDDTSHHAQMLDDISGFQAREATYWLVEVPSDRDGYLSLISTYSTTLSIPEPHRSSLIQCIGDLMDARFGGHITKLYRYDLVVIQRVPE